MNELQIEWFSRKTRRGLTTVKITKMGVLVFSNAAVEALQKQSVAYCLLGWAPTAKLVLFKHCSKSDPNAYRIRYYNAGNGASFSAKTFLDQAGIDYSKVLKIPIKINNSNADGIFLEVKIEEA